MKSNDKKITLRKLIPADVLEQYCLSRREDCLLDLQDYPDDSEALSILNEHGMILQKFCGYSSEQLKQVTNEKQRKLKRKTTNERSKT